MSELIFAISGGKAVLQADGRMPVGLRHLIGSGLLVAVGYIDPGNWATDIAGGSRFGYHLLMVVFVAAFLALGFQVWCRGWRWRPAGPGHADGAPSAAPARPRRLAGGQAAVLATALANTIGGAIALRLFGIPLMAGVAMTGAGTYAVALFARGNAQRHERIIGLLLAIVSVSFMYLLFQANPSWTAVTGQQADGALRAPEGFMIAWASWAPP